MAIDDFLYGWVVAVVCGGERCACAWRFLFVHQECFSVDFVGLESLGLHIHLWVSSVVELVL